MSSCRNVRKLFGELSERNSKDKDKDKDKYDNMSTLKGVYRNFLLFIYRSHWAYYMIGKPPKWPV